MSDLISRQAAIEAMEQTYCDIERVKKRPVTKGEQAIFLDMRGVVRSLPSVEPERNPELRKFIEKVFETLREMDDAVDVICNLDVDAVFDRMEVDR